MLFSLGQVLGLLCNPAESTQKASLLPCGRPADAKEYSKLGLQSNPSKPRENTHVFYRRASFGCCGISMQKTHCLLCLASFGRCGNVGLQN